MTTGNRTVAYGLLAGAIVILSIADAAAQAPAAQTPGKPPQGAQTQPLPPLSNVDLCNGRDRSSPQPQISGCTALIHSDIDNAQVLSIAYNNRADAYVSEGQYDVAIQDYNQSIKLNPTYAKPFNNRGVAYEKQGNYDRALDDLNAAIKLDPNYADAFVNRAETYQKKGDYADAVKDFDEALRLKPTLDAVVWNERCFARTVSGDPAGALTDCNEAIRQHPNDAATLDSRGLAYLKAEKWDLALADFNAALHLNHNLPSSLYGRGYAEVKKGNAAAGNTDMAAATALDQHISLKFAGYGLH